MSSRGKPSLVWCLYLEITASQKIEAEKIALSRVVWAKNRWAGAGVGWGRGMGYGVQ